MSQFCRLIIVGAVAAAFCVGYSSFSGEELKGQNVEAESLDRAAEYQFGNVAGHNRFATSSEDGKTIYVWEWHNGVPRFVEEVHAHRWSGAPKGAAADEGAVVYSIHLAD